MSREAITVRASTWRSCRLGWRCVSVVLASTAMLMVLGALAGSAIERRLYAIRHEHSPNAQNEPWRAWTGEAQPAVIVEPPSTRAKTERSDG